MQKALIIGGTGMLAQATLWVAARHDKTVLVSRHATAFAGKNSVFLPIDLDWSSKNFARILKNQLEDHLPLTTTVIWMHNADQYFDSLGPLFLNARCLIVLGSMDENPNIPGAAQGMIK